MDHINRRQVKVGYIRPFFYWLYSTYGRVVWLQRLFSCNPGSNPLQRSWCLNQILNADDSSFHLEYGSLGTLIFGRSTYLVSGPCLLCFSYAIFTIRQPGPWRRKQIFEAINVTLLANEDVFLSWIPPALLHWSGDGSPGHLDRFRSYFRRSFVQCCRPRHCTGSWRNKFHIIIVRFRWRVGLSLDDFTRG